MISSTRSPALALGLLKSLSWAKYLPVVLGLLLVFSACDSNDVEEEETPFERFDTDDDGEIDSDEFSASFSQMGDFDNFDADAGGDIDSTEFNAGILGVFDTDDSGVIDETEFNAGNEFFGVEQNLSDFDADASGDLDATEFNQAVGDAGSFDDFDADLGGTVDEDEFNEGIFGGFDRDLSGGIDEDEFNTGSEFFDVDTFGVDTL